jgi:hypothetical protein
MNSLEWIKALKVGDEVAIDNSTSWHRHNYEIVTVVKITATGRIRTSKGSLYYPNGFVVGQNGSELKQITPEILEFIERRKLRYKLDFNKFEKMLNSERLKLLLEWQKELLDK